MKLINKGFYITRDKGNWFYVTPFRRIYCFNLEEATQMLYESNR